MSVQVSVERAPAAPRPKLTVADVPAGRLFTRVQDGGDTTHCLMSGSRRHYVFLKDGSVWDPIVGADWRVGEIFPEAAELVIRAPAG